MTRRQPSMETFRVLLLVFLLVAIWFGALGDWEGVGIGAFGVLFTLPSAFPEPWASVRRRIPLRLSRAQQWALGTALILVPYIAWNVLEHGRIAAIVGAVALTVDLVWLAVLVAREGWSEQGRPEV